MAILEAVLQRLPLKPTKAAPVMMEVDAMTDRTHLVSNTKGGWVSVDPAPSKSLRVAFTVADDLALLEGLADAYRKHPTLGLRVKTLMAFATRPPARWEGREPHTYLVPLAWASQLGEVSLVSEGVYAGSLGGSRIIAVDRPGWQHGWVVRDPRMVGSFCVTGSTRAAMIWGFDDLVYVG